MKKGFTSVKWEISAVMLLLVLCSVALLTFFSLKSQKESLTEEVNLRGEALAKSVAGNAADFILTNYTFETAKILKEASQNKGVRYVVVTGLKGEVLAHSDVRQAKQPFNAPARQGVEPVVLAAADGEKIIDFIAPVVAKGRVNLGNVHLGISYSIVEATIKAAYMRAGILTFVVLLLSVIASLLLGIAITKPIGVLVQGIEKVGAGDLTHKIKLNSKNELGMLATAFNEMTSKLKGAQEREVSRRSLERELEIARDIQLSMIPKKIPDIKGLNVAAYYHAAKEVGGDYYDVINLGSGRCAFVMADVSGKGVPAALVMAMAGSVIRTQAPLTPDPRELMIKLNDVLVSQIRPGIFVTAFYGVFDAATGVLEYVSAGHNETFHYKKSDRTLYEYVPGGFPAAMGASDYFGKMLKKASVTLGAGDKIVLFTDGINEAMNSKNVEFGIDTLKGLIVSSDSKNADQTVKAINQAVTAHTAGAEQSDDIAVLVIEKT